MNTGREHWAYCDEHKTKWIVGSNLFSSWREQTEEDWSANAKYLADYREIVPPHVAVPTVPDSEIGF